MDYCRIFAYALICIAIVLGEEIKTENSQVVLTSDVPKQPEALVKDQDGKTTELNLKVENTSAINASVSHENETIKVTPIDEKTKPITYENSKEFLAQQQVVPPKRKTRQIYINKKFLTLQALQDNDDKNPEQRTVLITLTTLGLAKKWLLLRLKKRFVFPFLFRSTGDVVQDSVENPNNVLYIDRRHIEKLNQMNLDEQDAQGRAEDIDDDSDENYYLKQSQMLRQLKRLKSLNNERRFHENKNKLKNFHRRNF